MFLWRSHLIVIDRGVLFLGVATLRVGLKLDDIKKQPWVQILIPGVLMAVVALLLLWAADECYSKGSTVGEVDGSKADIVIRVASFDDEYGDTLIAIVKYMAETAYGYTVEVVETTDEKAKKLIQDGILEVILAASNPDTESWFKSSVSSGALIDAGPAYVTDSFSFNTAISPKLETMAPDLFETLQDMQIDYAYLKETHEWYEGSDIVHALPLYEDGVRAAVYYFWNFNYENTWKTWMAWAPAERLRDSTERFTGLRYPELYVGIEYDLDRFGRGSD
ncbi:MAG: hypothetical protein CL904_05980 [Dehalococcoidia bacterium]|nr:hypothetical protein [Dehalococcoidia bacterium]MQG15605.1 hypothetical protein [SAR202 cluster bacterium]